MNTTGPLEQAPTRAALTTAMAPRFEVPREMRKSASVQYLASGLDVAHPLLRSTQYQQARILFPDVGRRIQTLPTPGPESILAADPSGSEV